MTVVNHGLHTDYKKKPQTSYNRESPAVHALLILFCVACLLPLLLIVSISFSTEQDLLVKGFSLIPLHFSLDAYGMIFESPERIVNAYQVTVITTAASTLLSLVVTSMMAFALSRPNFRYRKIISFYLFFTMLFSGGLVPYYILMTKYLGMTDKIWSMIVPFLFSAYNAFLMRTNFQTLPLSLSESAKIDGASEFRIYWQIVIPLSTPTIATVGLFVGLGVWNDWYQCLLFINKSKLYSLQMMLQMMMANLSSVQNDMNSIFVQDLMKSRKIPGESLRMAMCLVAIGPVVLLFPFLQKYFVRGLTVGSVKG